MGCGDHKAEIRSTDDGFDWIGGVWVMGLIIVLVFEKIHIDRNAGELNKEESLKWKFLLRVEFVDE